MTQANVDKLVTELKGIREQLRAVVTEFDDSTVESALEKLEDRATKIGQAWSGSWIGYQAHVYYEDFQTPPPGVYFDKEWGLRYSNPSWIEYPRETVVKMCKVVINEKTIEKVSKNTQSYLNIYENHKQNLYSIVQAFKQDNTDIFLDNLISRTDNSSEFRPSTRITPPSQEMTRDSVAIQQGIWMPPHIETLEMVEIARFAIARIRKLTNTIKLAIDHMNRRNLSPMKIEAIGKRIFIGHGHSNEWLKLEKFLKDRLNLEVDEFNRVPTAGVTITERLSAMLDHAKFAFLIMTGEDEMMSPEEKEKNPKYQPRMNVIHEAGLFQGRLGFDKAIILLEEGCEEFSNIHGLGQIRFEKGRLNATFEEIRQLLEDRGVISV